MYTLISVLYEYSSTFLLYQKQTSEHNFQQNEFIKQNVQTEKECFYIFSLL